MDLIHPAYITAGRWHSVEIYIKADGTGKGAVEMGMLTGEEKRIVAEVFCSGTAVMIESSAPL